MDSTRLCIQLDPSGDCAGLQIATGYVDQLHYDAMFIGLQDIALKRPRVFSENIWSRYRRRLWRDHLYNAGVKNSPLHPLHSTHNSYDLQPTTFEKNYVVKFPGDGVTGFPATLFRAIRTLAYR